MEKFSRRIILTVGDPGGIGPEIAIKAAIALYKDPTLRPVVVADRHMAEPLAKASGFSLVDDAECWGTQQKSIDFCEVHSAGPKDYEAGRPNAAAGRATIAYVEKAIELIRDGVGRAIVACPHSETSVNMSGRTFSGYPSLLAELQGTGPDSVFLMLVGGGLRIVHVTLHERLQTALERLTPALVERAARSGHEALLQLGLKSPRIGVFGINPHAGEDGLFGDDDDRVVVPAIDRLKKDGFDIHGPVGADILLGQGGFDAFVAIYHDQGHIPVKLLAEKSASAMSIGAGFLFSSVGHGAAFDIAGQGQASCEATLAAIRLVGGVQ